MEEVDLPSEHARELFGIVAEHKEEFRFFESRRSYLRLGQGEIPVGKMIADWSRAVASFLSVSPYADELDFQLDFPLKVTHQWPIKEPLATYAVIYFLSSLVRYHPDFLESLLASRDAWLMERFINSAPVTLLLYMRNLIHGRNVAFRAR
jgi:hypothetical protein